MSYGKEFEKYATKHQGISSLHLNEFKSIHGNYISPTIIEERHGYRTKKTYQFCKLNYNNF